MINVGTIKQNNLIKHWRFSSLILLFLSFAISLKGQTWQDTYNSALNAYSNSDYRNAIQEGEKALALANNSDEKLYTLKMLSATYSEVGNYKKGLEYGKQEIDLCDQQSVPDSVYINSLNSYINNYLGLQDFNSAIPFQRQIVAMGSSLYEPDDLEHNQHISDLGYSYLMTEKYDSAIFFLNEANKYLLNIEGGAEDFLINQLNVGQAYYQKEEFLSSLKALEGLKGILENNGLDGYQIYAEAMESLALVQYSMGKFAESRQAYEVASKKYQQLGFSVNDLVALNQQLALAYLKNELLTKSDSVQSLVGGKVNNQNMVVNQLTLAYKRYSSREYIEAEEILHKVLGQLSNTIEDEELLAEAIVLDSRLHLELYQESFIDSIEMSIRIFAKLKKTDKTAEAELVKAKIYTVPRD